jgi:hypothetical protein
MINVDMNKRMELAKGSLFTMGMEVYMLELFKKKSRSRRPNRCKPFPLSHFQVKNKPVMEVTNPPMRNKLMAHQGPRTWLTKLIVGI